MITLHKPISRRTRNAFVNLYQSERRQIVVQIRPGGLDDDHDYIAFREAGRREWFLFPIDVAFKVAIRGRALAEARVRQEAKRAKQIART